jgi:hypothetical protein
MTNVMIMMTRIRIKIKLAQFSISQTMIITAAAPINNDQQTIVTTKIKRKVPTNCALRDSGAPTKYTMAHFKANVSDRQFARVFLLLRTVDSVFGLSV